MSSIKMKVYVQLHCDYGHSWEDFVDENAEVPKVCPKGHEAVTYKKMPPIDQVQVTIRPAGRLADSVKEQYIYENKVQIIVSDIQETWKYHSQSLYSWREAEEILRKFEKRSLAQAKAIIERSIQNEQAI
jgi:hypothetical protein